MEKVVEIVHRFSRRCQHNKFIVDTELGYVRCGICDEHLNPMWVIKQYGNEEHRLFKQLERLQSLVKELEKKTRCKCDHCGKMTTMATQREVNKAYWGH